MAHTKVCPWVTLGFRLPRVLLSVWPFLAALLWPSWPLFSPPASSGSLRTPWPCWGPNRISGVSISLAVTPQDATRFKSWTLKCPTWHIQFLERLGVAPTPLGVMVVHNSSLDLSWIHNNPPLRLGLHNSPTLASINFFTTS